MEILLPEALDRAEIELLPPEKNDDEREALLHEALAGSARDLSVDERYVLRRLASVVAQTPTTGSIYLDHRVMLPVAEFAAHANITFKVARRRLDVAAYALMGRVVELNYDDGWAGFPWLSSKSTANDSYELGFNGHFIKYLLWVATGEEKSRSSALRSFADAIDAPAVIARGSSAPRGLEIVLVSRLKARSKRPKALKWWQLSDRVGKRLKRVMSREEVLDALDAAVQKSPQSKMRGKYHDFTHRDITGLYDWIMSNKDKPDFMQF